MATPILKTAGRAVAASSSKLSAPPAACVASGLRPRSKGSLFGHASAAAEWQALRLQRCMSAEAGVVAGASVRSDAAAARR
jgi:hypothetical protein